MKDKAGGHQRTNSSDRGVSPLVGIILLFGMVIIGAILVMVSGWALLDSLESQSNAEVTRSTVEVTDHSISTTASTGEMQLIPYDEATYVSDGSAELVWFDNSSGGIPSSPDDDANLTINELGAIEYELEDRTIAYQSGGIWEYSDGSVQIRSAPRIDRGADSPDNVPRIQLLTLDEDDAEGSEVTVQQNQSSDLASRLDDFMNPPSDDKTDLGLVIDSENYNDAWYAHLNSEFETVDRSGSQVKVIIEDAAEPESQIVFEGGTSGVDADRLVAFNATDTFDVTTDLTNRGTVPGSDTVELSVNPTNSTTVTDIEPSETVETELSLDATSIGARNKNNLSQYGEYTYHVNTSSDNVSGTFSLSYPDTSYYKIENIRNRTIDGGTNESIVVDFTNIGITNDTRDITASLTGDPADFQNGDHKIWNQNDLADPDDANVSIEPWRDGSIEFVFNRSALPESTYTFEFTIDNPNSGCGGSNKKYCTKSVTFTKDSGTEVDEDEVYIKEPSTVNVSVIGTEISYEGPTYGESAYFVDENGTVDRSPPGKMVNDGSGNFGYSFDAPEPRSEWDTLEKSDNGGWVATNGAEPYAVEDRCNRYWCSYSWEWDATELEYNSEEGYQLNWESGEGQWRYDGENGTELVTVDYEKRWGTVTAVANIAGEEIQFTPQGENDTMPAAAVDDSELAKHNLNTFGTQRKVWDYGTEIEEGGVSITTTYYPCHEWKAVGVDKSDATGENQTYIHKECVDLDTENAITAEGGSDTAESNGGFVMTRDANRSEMPDIEKGYPRQRDVNEVFQDGTSDIELVDDELQLGKSDFAFMMETTMTQRRIQNEYREYDWRDVDTSNQSQVNRAAWDIAANYRDHGEGDPNFNDVIGFVQIDGGGTYVSLENPHEKTIPSYGAPWQPKSDRGDRTLVADESATINVGVDEIVIG